MAVVIPFQADLSEVEKALERLVADAHSRPIQLGGSFASGAAAAAGFTGSPVPTVQGIFGGPAGGVAGAFGNINSIQGGSFLQTVGGFGAGGASPGFFNASYGAGGGSVASAIFGFPGSAATATGTGLIPFNAPGGTTVMVSPAFAAGGGGGGGFAGGGGGLGGGTGGGFADAGAGGGGWGWGGGGRFFGLRTSGLERYFGLGYLAREALRGVQIDQEHFTVLTLAGRNQREVLKAEEKFRSSWESITVVGQAAGAIADELGEQYGFGPTGTKAVMRAADAQEQRTELRRRFAREGERLRDETSVNSLQTDYERDVARADISHRETTADIRERAARLTALDSERIAAEESLLASTRLERQKQANIRAIATGTTPVDIEVADRTTIASMRSDAAATVSKFQAADQAAEDRRAAVERSIIERNRARTISGFNSSLDLRRRIAEALPGTEREEREQGERSIRENLEKVTGNPNSTFEQQVRAYELAQIERGKLDYSIRSRNFNEANSYRDSVEIQRIENSAAKARLAARPLDAALKANEAKRIEELGKLDPLADAEEFDEKNLSFDLRAAELKREDAINRRQRLRSAEARSRVLDVALSGGRYAGERAEATSIKETALLRVDQLIDEGAAQNKNLIRQTLINAGKEEQLLGQNFLNRFKPEEIDINRSASNGGFNNAEVINTLKSIDDSAKAIKEASQNWGKAQ